MSYSDGFKQKIQDRAQLRQSEEELWHRWQAGDESALGPLYKSLAPIFHRTEMNFRGNLPPGYVGAVVRKHALHALRTWDPHRVPKVQLNTHIMHRLQKVKRDVSQYQNPGRLAEASHWAVTSYQHVRANLRETLGREPTVHELGDALGKPHQEVSRLQSGSRRDLAAVEGQAQWKEPEDRQRRALLEDFAHELPPLEKHVFHMTFGMAGHEPTQTKDIATKLRLPPGHVTQIKASIATKFQALHSARSHSAGQ